MIQKSDDSGFEEVLDWRALLYMSSILARLFGKATCNTIFFMLGVAEGYKISNLLLQKLNLSTTENGLDINGVLKELTKILVESNYVERFWFFESKIPNDNVKEYHVRVSNNAILSMLLEQDHNVDERENSLFCNFMRGILKSIFTKFLGHYVQIIESECQLKNKQFCEYVIRKA
ncbi:MAG: 4-vinyl reductase [Nitrososphaerota archaeon]|nr:4-vinyl reductase [Aigarchaeota archaeon]MDW8076858.1 4-vinyl reductase [Nitrososphaerota archaeon]